VPHPFDSSVVRAWVTLALDAVREGREEIDAINVFPVADGDTGTNLQRTLDAAVRALDPGAGDRAGDRAASGLRSLARGALLGACGNSGTILAQLLRGMAEVYAHAEETADDGVAQVAGGGRLLAAALRRAAESAYEAVARPVEGTMLTVARAAADAAERAARGTAHGDGDGNEAGEASVAAVARAAYEGADVALSATTGQLEVLRRAGVVDAGGSGLVAVLGALADALADPGAVPRPRPSAEPSHAAQDTADDTAGPAHADLSDGDPAYEVMYLLDADEAAMTALRERLDGLGDSLVVGGGDGLWSVHVHVDDAGAAVEAGIAAGTPHRIRITHLATGESGIPCAPAEPPSVSAELPTAAQTRAVVAVVHGDGLAGLCEEAGAVVVRAKEVADSEALTAAVRATGAAEVVLVPNDADLHASAVQAAEQLRTSAEGVRAAVVPTRAAVQGIAALAVHDPERRFDDDVVGMTAAAGSTRFGEVIVAERRSWTMAGVCQAGDVLGLVEGDVAVIGSDVADTAAAVLERMLAAGGEMVTLVIGEHAPHGLASRLEEQVRSGHLAVETVVYEGRQQFAPLLIGVE
jgi:uncharacterized protein